MPALAALKAQATYGAFAANSPVTTGIESILPQFIKDKGYETGVVLELARRNRFGKLVGTLLLRSPLTELDAGQSATIWNYFGSRAAALEPGHASLRPYKGDVADSVLADRLTTTLNGPRVFMGQGATGLASFSNLRVDDDYGSVPIAILGAGPAGIIAARSLNQIGFHNVTLFDEREPYGIWSQPHVYRGTRNNPRDVEFADLGRLRAAPGGGEDVQGFLRRLLSDNPHKRSVVRVEPGDLRHKLHFGKDHADKTYPIVINALGLGKPSPVSDPDRMVGNPGRAIPKRWQQPRFERRDVAGKRFVFIGLGNSTAEMLRQMHRFQDQGVDVDYVVFTHYPRDSVHSPSDTVVAGSKAFRMFRDISKPQLTSFQGDLPDSRNDYYRALLGGKIVSDVRKWEVSKDGKKIAAFNKKGASLAEVEFSDIYLLTGYQHSLESYASMGCTYDKTLHCALHDYDGEITRTKGALGADRLYRGYFGFGAVLDAPHNPNTVVIPGMAYRVTDLMFGVVMRAGEYLAAKK
jgi:hypothetical protein